MGSSALAKEVAKGTPFKAKFAPSPGQLFGGKGKKLGYVDQLKLSYDLGFRAWEDNGLNGQKNALLEKIAEFMKDKKMEFGVSVITGGAGAMFNKPTDEQKERVKKDLERGIEVAKITGQTNMTMIPGARDESMTREEQIKASVDNMRLCCDLVEEHGIIMAQEPLSHGVKGGQPLIRSFEDGHLLCKLVDRKSCKLLADFYHEGQIGNGEKLIENATKTWDQVSYVQYGASPGRKEPGTGKLDYVAVTQFLREKNYTGIIGMEHGQSKKGQEGLDALIAAYRKIDA
ncbi:MAG: hydroxypyruvate isomerase [Akkermansiaceae bacterium]